MLQGSRLRPCPLCVLEAQEALGCPPCPSCHPARALLCTLLLEGLSFREAPWLLLVLLGLAPQEAPGLGGRHPDLQAAPVHLWNLEARGALACLEGQVNPCLQVTRDVRVAPEAQGIPLVLSGRLPRHILGSLCVREGLPGPGGLGALAGHSRLVPLAQGQRSQGALEARVVRVDHRGQEVLDLQVDPGQECHPWELFLGHLQAPVVQVSLEGLGGLFLQKGLEEKFLDARGLLSPLSAQAFPLDQVGPFHANLKCLWFLSGPSNRAIRSGRAARRDLLSLEDLVARDPRRGLLVQDPRFLLAVPLARASLDDLDTPAGRGSPAVPAVLAVLWALRLRASPSPPALPQALDIPGCRARPLDQAARTDLQDLLCFLWVRSFHPSRKVQGALEDLAHPGHLEILENR